jgi:hypothetical protein
VAFQAVTLYIEYSKFVTVILEQIFERLARKKRVVNATESAVVIPDIDLDASVHRDRTELGHGVHSVLYE